MELTRVGVDGGELLTPGTSGYYDELQPDGSLIFSIEGQDGIAISEGKRYTLELRADVRTWDGEEWRGEVTGTWTLSCVPETLQEASTPKETAATAAQDAQYRVILPEEYRSTGSMGLYAAIPAELGSAMAPEWINQSGVKQRTAELVTFEDGSELELEDELIFYREMEGTWDYNTLKRREEDQKAEPMILGAPSMACAVGDLAGWCRFGFPDEEPVPTLEKTAVTGITLEEAQADFAALLARVGITDYQCVYALEMDLARIHSLGERMNASIEQGRMRTNGPIYDYDAATAEDEGYYLDYCAMGLEANANETIQMEATAYITAKGFAFVSIRAPYLRGGQVGVAPSLVPVEEIAGRLPVDAAGSRFDIRVERVIDATLTWAPLRAKAPETGMVFSPVWLLTYQQADGESRGWAEYDAVTGQIIEADFR